MHKARWKQAAMPEITTYHHLHHCLPGRAIRNARIGDILRRVARIAGSDQHTRFPECVGQPATEAGHDHERDLHLDGRSRKFGNHPRSVLPGVRILLRLGILRDTLGESVRNSK